MRKVREQAKSPKTIETSVVEKAILVYVADRAARAQDIYDMALVDVQQYVASVLNAHHATGTYAVDKDGNLVELNRA